MTAPLGSEDCELQRLVILGAGAVGGTIGGLLHEAGHDVLLIARGAHGAAIRKQGLDVRLPERSFRAHIACIASSAQWQPLPGDVLFLATKLQDAESALDDVLAVAGPKIPIVCATNGIACESLASERFESVLSMVVWILATYLEAGQVRLYSSECRGVLDTGVHPRGGSALLDELCTWLRNAGFDALPRTDIQRWKYAKLITNLGSAAHALVQDDWRSVCEAAQAEGEELLDAAGIDRIERSEFRARMEHVASLAVDGAMRAGGSTWQSRERGKALETPWLEGAIVAIARELARPAPINSCLLEAALELRTLTAAEVLGAGDRL